MEYTCSICTEFEGTCDRYPDNVITSFYNLVSFNQLSTVLGTGNWTQQCNAGDLHLATGNLHLVQKNKTNPFWSIVPP